MQDVLIGYKWVRDEADLRVGEDLSVDFSSAKGKISEYDKNAIEAARLAAEALGGKTYAISCGADTTRKSFSDALARGLDEGIWVDTEGDQANAVIASRSIAAVAREKNPALIICAEGSSDDYARQTPSRIGAILDWPVATSVSKIEIEGSQVLVGRKMDDFEQVVKIDLPAVLSVLPEINPAPIPGLKAALEAKKKPVEERKLTDLDVSKDQRSKVEKISGYISERKAVLIEEESPTEIAAHLVELLKKEGIL